MLGIPLGLLIGAVTGLVLLLLLRTAWATSARQWKNIISIVGEILALPTFWFGGPWLTSKLLADTDFTSILPYYMASLAVMFLIIVIVPIFRVIIKTANEIENPKKVTNE